MIKSGTVSRRESSTPKRNVSIGLACAALLTLSPWAIQAQAGAEDLARRPSKLSFNRDIRPILADNCFKCHGQDAKQRKGALRLDDERAAKGPATSGSVAIVPGKVQESELYLRITAEDPEERMPPKDSGKSLSADEIAKLKQWIEEGAVYEGHWAFIPPNRPALPPVKNAAWCRNPIDFFILSKLESTGLEPSPEAEKTTLLKRLSLDLIGLPPGLEEQDAFLADRSGDAFKKQVERLLDSPHYGERWGRIWLDAARYADSDGYEKDKPRQVHSYRDWVVTALNRDLPYDEFIIEQIAGDMIAGASPDQVTATGLLRNSMINEEGGIDPEQFRMEAMFDRMDCVGKAILGLTIQCAQCHDHKYDPLSQDDYYRMFAFLNNAHESTVAVYTPAERKTTALIAGKVTEIEDLIRHQNPDWPERLAAWEKQLGAEPNWVVVRPDVDEDSTGGQKYIPQDDGSLLAQGYAPTKHTVELTVKTTIAPIRAIRLELLNDPNLPLSGPGRSIKGTAALTEIKAEAAPQGGKGKSVEVKIAGATADVNSPEKPLDTIYDDRSNRKRVTGPVAFAIDGKDETAWGIDVGPGRRNQPRKAVFTLAKPIEFPGGTVLTINLKQNHGGWNSDDNQNHNLGRFRISLTSAADAKADLVPTLVREMLAIAREKRTPDQTKRIFSYWRTTVPEWSSANAWIESIERQHPEGTSQLVLAERETPRSTHILQRGDFLKPGKAVTPGIPKFLTRHESAANPSRLTLANWLASGDSPTTARSLVNRVWQAYFGTGIVATSEDLGVQCEPPSHPELLDWLAVEFMESGWSLKHLHRLIVSSATYRQSSRVSARLFARDPYNRLLARGPRFRVDAELVRDIALSASGLLDRKVGGPSVCPPAPAFLFLPPVSYGPKVWKEATGIERYRRAFYTFRYRSVPYPMLQAFDAPNGDFACVRRTRSNTPLQALATLNEPIYVECARALARKVVEQAGSDESVRLDYAFRRCLARAPSDSEKSTLLNLLRKQVRRFEGAGGEAWAVAAGDSKQHPQLPPGVKPQDLAGWTVVARVLLNLDETITKE
jgi:mono/diheme cytochrome c family protein